MRGAVKKGLLRRSKKPLALSLGKRDPLIPLGKFLPLFGTHTAKYFAFMARLVSPATFSYCKTLSCRTRFHIPPSLFIHIVRPRAPLTASSSEPLWADTAQSGVRGNQRARASGAPKGGGLFLPNAPTSGAAPAKPHVPLLGISGTGPDFSSRSGGTNLWDLRPRRERS